jgi:hypothetical protein
VPQDDQTLAAVTPPIRERERALAAETFEFTMTLPADEVAAAEAKLAGQPDPGDVVFADLRRQVEEMHRRYDEAALAAVAGSTVCDDETRKAWADLEAHVQFERDFNAGKPIKLADGRIVMRHPDDPAKALVIPKPPSLAEVMCEAFKPGWSKTP